MRPRLVGVDLCGFLGAAAPHVGAAEALAESGGPPKADSGTWILGGANGYTGATTVAGGILIVNGNQSSATGNVSVNSNATLGGSGTIGGSTTINVNGKLAFNLNTPPGSHNKLDIGGNLTFSGASTLTITSSGGASTGVYTLITTTGDIGGTLPAVTLPDGWTANPLEVVGKNLVLHITSGPTTSTYQSWATGGQTFEGDANGDGVADGLAWFLGAGSPSDNAQGKMPTPTEGGGFLNLSFQRVNPYAPAKLYVQFGNNLTGWTELEIPEADSLDLGGTGVQVDVVEGDPDQVTVKLPTSYQSASGALFARLRAAEN